MKEFFNWLGVNEKIAKLVLWLFFIMASLIIVNIFFDSMGLPHYKLTVENLSKIKLNNFLNYMCALIVSLMNFYSIVFLVIRIKEYKKVLPYSFIYILILAITNHELPIVNQFIAISLPCIFIYFIALKNKKYIIYGIVSMLFSFFVQYICMYLFKVKYINISELRGINYLLSSLDYFIVMLFIILVKEVYLKYKKEA